jgi:hypothetical protein
MMPSTRTRAPSPVTLLSAIVFVATLSAFACSNSSSSGDGGATGSVTGTGGATSGTGGGRGGETGAGGSSGGATGTGGQSGATGTAGKGGTTGAAGQGGATGGTTGHGGAAGGGRGGTGAAGQGGTVCGTGAPCTGGRVCVHPNCGGGIAVCENLPDGGQCPSGWTYSSFCATGVGPGCTPPPCTPPPPYCVDLPAACSGTPTCSCLPTNVCTQNGGSGSCQFANIGEVTCASA